MKVRDLVNQAAKQFESSDSAKLDAQLLLAYVLHKNRTWLFTWDDFEVTPDDQKKFNDLINRRVKGEPIAYILSKREFWGLELECNASTLIPRPETEILVEQALQLGLSENARVLDLGTGTGAIALALASEKPDWSIQACDFSGNAVKLALRNKQANQIANVEIFQSNWLEQIRPGNQFDLIVSNPPYIDPKSHYLNEGDVRFEPKSALTAGNSGMADIDLIVSQTGNYLVPQGCLMLEHGFDQQQRVQGCFAEAGFTQIQTHNDLAGLPRVTLGYHPA